LSIYKSNTQNKVYQLPSVLSLPNYSIFQEWSISKLSVYTTNFMIITFHIPKKMQQQILYNFTDKVSDCWAGLLQLVTQVGASMWWNSTETCWVGLCLQYVGLSIPSWECSLGTLVKAKVSWLLHCEGHSVRLVSQSSDHLPLPTVEGSQAAATSVLNGLVRLVCLDYHIYFLLGVCSFYLFLLTYICHILDRLI